MSQEIIQLKMKISFLETKCVTLINELEQANSRVVVEQAKTSTFEYKPSTSYEFKTVETHDAPIEIKTQ